MSRRNNVIMLVGKIMGILLSVSIIITGICIMMQCVSIYNSGAKNQFSREKVEQAFSDISVPIIITVLLLIAVTVFNLFVSGVFSDKQNHKNSSYVLRALNLKKDISALNDPRILNEHKIRRINSYILAALSITGFGIFFAYVLNPTNFFDSKGNPEIIRVMSAFCICIVIPFSYAIVSVFINNKSLNREIEISRELVKIAEPKKAPTSSNKLIHSFYFKLGIIIICAVILLYGYFSGGTADVLAKASNLCTECIGLG
ncbi:MAG: hypothetical protein IJA55_01940 [Clostridia bacterium]|nr:hypothetical protein [Clostridia bacterium]